MELTAELKEMVFNYYCMSLDLDIAVLKSGLSDEETEEIHADKDFILRLKLEEAQVQTELMTSLRGLTTSENEAIRLRAILELGKMHYTKLFNNPSPEVPLTDDRPVNIIMRGVKPKIA